ncbi:glutelin type-A 1-like [Ananas comosus]|uniref:Glutelin type-A 1-like n=1 Tax=Ananas comosus TaxID=4615 RepID=A0A6P5EEU3_ANACO|nr:glutelin type-A 1-like [Ananas comosus]
MATLSSLFGLSLSLILLLLFHNSFAQLECDQGREQSPWQSHHWFRGQRECRLERLDALQPARRIQSEAGFTEFFDQGNEQFQCAGVSIRRRVIEPSGLLLPSYSNAPCLVYILQGRGITGTVFPGCPETYQSFQQQSQQQREEGGGQSQRFRDEHQKVHSFREGDIIALPAGVANWCYNDGDTPVVAITVFDTSNSANQLDPRRREFLLAGSHRSSERKQESFGQQTYEGQYEEQTGVNILSGFNPDLLAEAFGVNREVARRLQSQDDRRGEIVRVRHGLQFLRPSVREEQHEQYSEGREERRKGGQCNGLEEMYCALKTRENINDPTRADVYTPQGGRITSLNSQKFPILNLIQMSAERGVLRRNAFHAPHWNINAHSIMYVTGGRGRVQIVNNQGRTVFDGELRRGQVLVIPQNYAVLKRAQSEGFEWVSFKTNSNAMVNQIVGKASALRGMPVDVLMNAYRLSREEALRLKFNRGDQMTVFTPRSQEGPF